MIDKQFFSLQRTIAMSLAMLGVSNSPVLPAKAVSIPAPIVSSAVAQAKPHTELRLNILVETDTGTRGRGDTEKMNVLWMDTTAYQKLSGYSFSLASLDAKQLNPTRSFLFKERTVQMQGKWTEQGVSRLGQTTTRQAQNPPPPKDRGAPGQREGGASRNGDHCPSTSNRLTALVPIIQPSIAKNQHPALANLLSGSVLGLTVAEHPTFWFFVPYSFTSKRPVEFVLLDDAGKEVYTTLLSESATTPGVVGFQLPATAPPLKVNQRYNWYLTVYCNAQQSPEEAVYVSGWVERVALNSSLKQKLEQATPQELVALYQGAGIWHESITALAQRRRQNPQDATLKQEWEKLMQSIQLEALASQPITSMLSPKN